MFKYKKLFLTTTDTVPGIGAPMTFFGKRALYKIKKRSKIKKIIVMIGNMDQARKMKEWNINAEAYAKKYWPGKVSLVISDKLALRIPGNKKLRELIIKKGPVYMTSANISGKKQLSFKQAKEKFSQIKEVYNFGKGDGKPSKIIRVSDGKVLR